MQESLSTMNSQTRRYFTEQNFTGMELLITILANNFVNSLAIDFKVGMWVSRGSHDTLLVVCIFLNVDCIIYGPEQVYLYHAQFIEKKVM